MHALNTDQVNMDKIQKKELREAESQLKRAQSAKESIKFLNPFDTHKSVQREIQRGRDEAELAFSLAQIEAEKAFHVVETYGEKVEATKYRIDAILGRFVSTTSIFSPTT